jgi:hypothetical protein
VPEAVSLPKATKGLPFAAGAMLQEMLEVDNLHDASVGGHRAQAIIQVRPLS